VNLYRKAAPPLLLGCDAAQQRQQAVEVAALDLAPPNRPLLWRADPGQPLRALSSNATKTGANWLSATGAIG